MAERKSILLILTGSIAAYKSLELIRRLRERDIQVTAVMTRGAKEFITPLSVASLTGNPVYDDLFSLKDEVEMGHIRLSRETDLVLIAPATADILAKMAAGITDDLATTLLLATNKPVLVAPAMNVKMWEHPATQRNVKQLQKDGIHFVMPSAGDLACGEVGSGRLEDVGEIMERILSLLSVKKKLSGLRALVTSGPTHEPIDPVRFLGNRSSGKQGHAIAAELAAQGIEVTLISGPTSLPDPQGVTTVHVTSAAEMLRACEKTLPVDIGVFAAAVADWGVNIPARSKLKKQNPKTALTLQLQQNPDILKTIVSHKKRPALVVGFAAETENLISNARAKRKAKNCDWIVANDVSDDKGFDREENEVTLVTARNEEHWPLMSKQDIATKLSQKIAEHFTHISSTKRKRHG